MKIVGILLVAVIITLVFISGLVTSLSCNNMGVAPVWADAECDTTRFVAADRHYIKITCVKTVTDTLYIAITDTLYIDPNYPCIEDCLQINGLGHWQDCLEECLP